MIGFAAAMDLTMAALVVEPMKRDLSLSDVQIGLLQGTAYGVAYGICSMPFGRLIDSVRRTRLMVAGALIWVAALGVTAAARDVAPLVACRATLGGMTALLIPASLSLVGDLFPPERRSVAIGLLTAGQALGQGFGLYAGGRAFDALSQAYLENHTSLGNLAPWRVLYVIAAMLCLLLVPALASLREPARQERTGGPGSIGNALRRLWSFRGFIAPLLGALLFSVIPFQATSLWVAPLLMRKFALSPGQFSGWLSAITLGGGIMGAISGGALAELCRRHMGPRAVLLPALAAAVAAAPLSLFGISPDLPVFGFMLAVSLFCAGLIPTLGVLAFTLNIPNEIRGLAVGVYVMISALFGTATAPAVIALVSRAMGGEAMLGPALATVSVPCFLASAVFFGLAIRSRANIEQKAHSCEIVR
jgi:MFS family permease